MMRSRYQLRTAFNKVKISLRLKRWPMNRYDRTESSTVESGCLSPTITDASVSESCITNTTPLPSVKIEEDNHYIYHQQPEHYPEFDRKLLYSNAVKRGECPLSSFIPDIQFLPPLSHPIYDHVISLYENTTMIISDNIPNPLPSNQMADFMHYHDMKKLERDLSERLIGRVANGFRKVVHSMPITRCSRNTFETFFHFYKNYCKEGSRKLIGYDRTGSFSTAQGLSYAFEYPYLPTFTNRHWTINEYSTHNEEDKISVMSETLRAKFPG